MEKGQICQIVIEDMTNDGQGLGRVDGMAIFVKGAILGETVLAQLTKVKKNYALGRLKEILIESPFCIEPTCKQVDQCGGCTYGRLNYQQQLELKERQVREKLIRLGGLKNPKVNPIRGMENSFAYRDKASFPISTGGVITKKGGVLENLGKPTIGFYQAKSHQVVDCTNCQLQSEPAMAAAAALRQFMEEDNITAYDPKWQKGLMRHLIVKTAARTGEVMVILVVNGKGIPNAEKLVDMLDDAIFDVPVYENGMEYNLKSVIINVNKSKDMTGPIMGEECITIAGSPTITDMLGDLQFEISPLAFYQVNPSQMEVLYQIAKDYAGLTGAETLLDLYCGVGTIGLFCADKAREVIGIESVKGAVLDANRNAVINGIVNARYECGRAEEVLPAILGQKAAPEGRKGLEQLTDHADVVILDPPRSGCDENLLEAVALAGPERIVYVSCDPATLARDLKWLTANGYRFEEATPVDMFPWTGHVETVVLMSRKNK